MPGKKEGFDKAPDPLTKDDVATLSQVLQSVLDRVNTIYGGVDQFPGAYGGRTTESGHEEVAQFANAMIPLNHKTLYDAYLFNLNYSSQQLLRHTEDLHTAYMQVVQNTVNNQNNQFQNNNAATSRATDLLLNLDVREGAAISEVLQALAAGKGVTTEMIIALGEALARIQGK
jgi:hypothetical protein